VGVCEDCGCVLYLVAAVAEPFDGDHVYLGGIWSGFYKGLPGYAAGLG